MSRRNLELKVHIHSIDEMAERARRMGAQYAASLQQVDTYFRSDQGRLKLREMPGSAELIFYSRADSNGIRASDYTRVVVSDANGMKRALAGAIGIRGVVQKQRELYRWHNLRIHLDQVEGLGAFLEFEGVLAESDGEADTARRLDEACRAMQIDPLEGIPGSYSDLMGL